MATGNEKGDAPPQGKRPPRREAGAGSLSSDSEAFGGARGDAGIDADLERIEREDGSLLAGGRHDVKGDTEETGEIESPGAGTETDADADARSTPVRGGGRRAGGRRRGGGGPPRARRGA